jgi:hypothetical protein
MANGLRCCDHGSLIGTDAIDGGIETAFVFSLSKMRWNFFEFEGTSH